MHNHNHNHESLTYCPAKHYLGAAEGFFIKSGKWYKTEYWCSWEYFIELCAVLEGVTVEFYSY